MRPLWLILATALMAGVFSSLGEEFESDVPPTVTYAETYDDTVVVDTKLDDYSVIPRSTLRVTAVCSMRGVELASIDQDTTVSIEFEGLSGAWVLGDDPAYKKGNTTATIPLIGTDPVSGDDVRVGRVNLVWNNKTVTITLTAKDDPSTYEVMAADQALSGEAESNLNAESSISIIFGDRELSARPVYIRGSVAYEDYEKGDISETLAHVSLTGEIDSTLPAVTILNPLTGTRVLEAAYTIIGTASDDRGVAAVFVRLNENEEVEATLGIAGAWSLPVSLKAGANTVIARAMDVGGNSVISELRSITYVTLGELTIGAEGTAAGQVSGDFFPGLSYTPGATSSTIVTQQEEGAELVITATPGAGALFDGWISNYPSIESKSPRLTFKMVPGLTLTARFVPNVFRPVQGTYGGLLESHNPAGRGSITIELGSSGSFSSSIRLGGSTLPLKGVFGADGTFNGAIWSDQQLFDVNLRLFESSSGIKQITGSFRLRFALDPQGNSLPGTFESTITADLSVFAKKVREVDAAHVGDYNVIIAPPSGNEDENFPKGIGFGRVTVRKSGVVQLIGRLGDGTPVTASSLLNEDFSWSLYAPLYKDRGALSGRVSIDLLASESDLSGLLNWSRPAARARMYSAGFAGQVHLRGAKYSQPFAGQRVFLNPEGLGELSLQAPEVLGFSVETMLPPLEVASAIYVNTANRLIDGDPILGVSGKINAATGLFTGSFYDTFQQKRVRFSGAVLTGGTAGGPKGNVAGGFFIRGNRTGSVQISAPVSQLP